jgi:hypothetical protein
MPGNQGPRIFKRCALCGKEWSSREEFLHDTEIRLIGFQKISENVQTANKVAGLLIYNHTKPICGTTLSIPAQQLWIRALSPVGREPLEKISVKGPS